MPAVDASPAAQAIVTPEAVVLDLERAGLASRTIAILIDVLALAAVVVALALIAAVTVLAVDTGAGIAALVALTSLLTVVAWFTGFETLWRGRTPGKAAMGLRVVSADGTAVRFTGVPAGRRRQVDFVVGRLRGDRQRPVKRDQRLGVARDAVVRERAASGGPVWFQPPVGRSRRRWTWRVTTTRLCSYLWCTS